MPNIMCLNDCGFQFQEYVIKFLYSFCQVIESQEDEEDSVNNLLACVDIKANENAASNNLIFFTRNCMLGSFLPQLHRLSFRCYKTKKWYLLIIIALANPRILLFLEIVLVLDRIISCTCLATQQCNIQRKGMTNVLYLLKCFLHHHAQYTR